MCTCCQNGMGFGCRNRCGCCASTFANGCASTFTNGCASTFTNGCNSTFTNGCARNTWCGSAAGNANASSSSACGGASFQSCPRYVSFPVSGTAYVPTSAIHFCPNVFWTAQNEANSNAAVSSGCGCFGRCGGAAAIANFNQDYYARQYGLND